MCFCARCNPQAGSHGKAVCECVSWPRLKRDCAPARSSAAPPGSKEPPPLLLLLLPRSAGFLCTFPTSPAVFLLAGTEGCTAKSQGSWRELPYSSRTREPRESRVSLFEWQSQSLGRSVSPQLFKWISLTFVQTLLFE